MSPARTDEVIELLGVLAPGWRRERAGAVFSAAHGAPGHAAARDPGAGERISLVHDERMSDLIDLAGKTIIVTGASSGIG